MKICIRINWPFYLVPLKNLIDSLSTQSKKPSYTNICCIYILLKRALHSLQVHFRNTPVEIYQI